MVSKYSANPTHTGPGRPPCESCGAAWRLHLPAGASEADTVLISGRRFVTARGRARLEAAGGLVCPEAYRPDTLEVARRELAAAEASGDEARVFVARGNLQRLEGRP